MTDIEKQILSAAQAGVAKAIADSLSGYSSPLTKLVNEVVGQHATQIQGIMRDAFSTVVSTGEFKASVMQAFQHKVAKMLVSNLEGSVEKAVHQLKQDPTIRARMVIAIEEIVNQSFKSKTA